jgi:hypothetical protein
MSAQPPEFYFRVKDNGALVFRVSAESRTRRLELEQIANVNINNGSIKPQGDRDLTDAERAEIERWMAERKTVLADREVEDILRTIDHLQLTAHWVQSKATDAQLDTVTNELLMAMHDLRSVLVRKRSERMGLPGS